MSHERTRLVAMLFAGLLVSSLLVAPVAGATDRDDHDRTSTDIDEERREAGTDEADGETADEPAERRRVDGWMAAKAAGTGDGDGWGDDAPAAHPWVDVYVYPNGTIVIVIDPWGDDDDGANDGDDGDESDRPVTGRDAHNVEVNVTVRDHDGYDDNDDGRVAAGRTSHNVEVNATVRGRTKYDDLTMTRGAKQGEMMLVERGYVGGTEAPAREVTGR